jgi:hypothetical protein
VKQDASYFEGQEAILVYIAKKLKDALRLESVFNEAGVDYGVEADEYRGGVVFQSARVGAFFYVLEPSAAAARDVMTRNRFVPYVDEPKKLEPPPSENS